MYFIILILFILIFLMYKFKIKVKWSTFLRRGFKPNKNRFGVYCYCGKQGSGKTYSVIEFLNDNKDKVIYANLKSIQNIPYTYIANLEELLKLRDEHDIIIFYDEIFTEITKHTKLSSDVMDFLAQMRKRRIILLTTCQEWRLLPLEFRLFVRFQINCSLVRIPLFKGILVKNMIDGEDLKWSDEDQDFVGTLITNTITHTRKSIANCYDTFEQIGKYSNYKDVSVATTTKATEWSVVNEELAQDFYETDFELEDFDV